MICLSRADEGALRHLEYNQSPRALAAEHTTRQDLNGISNLREHVAAGQEGDGGCNGGGIDDMDERRRHGGLPPGSPPGLSASGLEWSSSSSTEKVEKMPSPCLGAASGAATNAAAAGLSLPSLPSLPAVWGWISWLASVVVVSLLFNYLALSGRLSATPVHHYGEMNQNVAVAVAVATAPRTASLTRRQSTCASSGVSSDEYNTALHAGALLIIWFVSTTACGFPLLARRMPGLRIPQRFFFVVRHFGTGVLIATAFVHLLPTAFISLGDPCLGDFWVSDYPAIPGAIALAAIFFVTVIEMVFHPARRGCTQPSYPPAGEKMTPAGHCAGEQGKSCAEPCHGAAAQDGAKPAAPMRDMQPPRRRSGSMGHNLNRLSMIEASDGDGDDEAGTQHHPKSAPTDHHVGETVVGDGLGIPAGETPSALSPEQKLRKERLQCMLLELGILFHSIFIGMALAVSVGNEFVILLIAIIFHQTFEGLALGSRIAAIQWSQSSRRQPWLMAAAYGCTTPLGQAIGIATHSLYSPDSEAGLVVVGVMNAISAGLLTFASLVELLSEDFLSDESWEILRGRKRVVACVIVFLGAFCMSLVGAWA